ncbi:MAG: MFS transporter [Parachlamydiaceae bacterium]|nr:MFS transporter [Parachlamydiaceae bacterium]
MAFDFFLNIFKPAPHISELTDPEQVKSDYKYWRIRILYSIFIGYAFYYFTRKSFIFAMPGIMQELNLDKSQLGIMSSIFALTYGASKFFSGVLSDQSNPRYFMAFGLIVTGILNIFFGMSSSVFMFAIFWGLNGWFQGFGWPPCVRFLTHWYSHSERGSWWSIWTVSQNVGAFLIPWIVGFTLQYFGWRAGMYVPGVLCIFGGLFLVNRLRDTPQSLGLPSIERFRNDYAGKKPNDSEEQELTTRQLVMGVLTNKYIWMLAIAYFFVYVIRMGIGDWTSLFLIEAKGYSRLGANGSVSLFEAGGFFGSLCAGWISDRLFQARRGPVNALFAIGLTMAVLLFWHVPQGYAWMDSCALFAIGFAIFGPQMLIGVAAAELAHKKASATATGLTGWVAYIGAASAGYPLGSIIDKMGWEGFFWAMVICCFVSVILLLPLWNVTRASVTPPPVPETEPQTA